MRERRGGEEKKKKKKGGNIHKNKVLNEVLYQPEKILMIFIGHTDTIT